MKNPPPRVESVAKGLTVVVAAGEIDIYSAPQLKETLYSAITGDLRGLLLDMSAVTFIDSTGLAVLVDARKRAQAIEANMALVIQDPNVRKVFEITALDQVFALHETREAARLALG